ncbi:DUF1569 domain-containing protein [Polaribacter aquimarinus]|uniref:DUF1569 domain-containing protein n=1 Tax=Polaribacter aquimarinus TaxID=2100726 RepID=A0A2U2JCP0_9FLAO|nr:DUF1569 domain-containing protein [Polaribacter aquimarinus]PWG06110.1 DUF1569 domain-containing protein [Polaribacter aquimarinus]
MNIISLENKLNSIENYISDFEQRNLKISKATVGWHLDHSLKVINAVISSMEKSDPNLYQDNFKFLGKLLLSLNFFPKGKAKAPKYLLPPDTILKEEIVSQLKLAKENINKIEKLDTNVFFKHPLFGNVNKKRVVPFLNAHTNHHLKIVKSILK